jgi:iron(III) transport system permease protein
MRFRPEPAVVLGVICLAALSFLVIVPIGWLFISSFQDNQTQAFTLRNYIEAFSHRIYLEPIFNSLKLAVSVAVIATIAGTALAWLVSRTDLPGRAVLRPLVLPLS